MISASCNGSSVSAYDHDRGVHLTGTIPLLYDHDTASHFSLQPTGNGSYNGYDHETAEHFTVNVSNNGAQIYDHGKGEFFQYQG
jgi:hypothetical protein